jgi:hypothetical protein
MKALVVASTQEQYRHWLYVMNNYNPEDYPRVTRPEHFLGYNLDTSVIILNPNLSRTNLYYRLKMEMLARFDSITYERT